MSKKESVRIPTLERLRKGEVTAKEAASILDLSVRHIRRLKKRFKKKGVKGLIHRSRGRESNNKIPDKVMDKVVKIVEQKYPDFGPTLAHEKLTEIHGFDLSVETLRKKMIERGLWRVKKRKVLKVHQQRQRRLKQGELVQMDASPHRWFEERASVCNLLLTIDDATGKIMEALFSEGETTNAYFLLMKSYLFKYGKPLSLYVDRNSIFKVSNNKSNPSKPTQFGRAMGELEIELILANTPQAKGRVERANSTLQDRLVKELRLKGISSIGEGNKFLAGFIEKFNKKFAVEPKDSRNAHKPLTSCDDLDRILVKKYKRTLSRNLEFQFENSLYQIKTDRPTYAMRNAAVLVTVDTKDKVRVYYKDKRLNYTVADKGKVITYANPKQVNGEVDKLVKGSKYKPAKDHPWRQFSI